ncbi:hypothetical protein FHS43_003050 [Streptosporangium becharense]|uniref:Uncharacterized protein n=1 Tax=Streptosporangium becharense TaxID=1816182 RepID=A0A7W9IKH3_9ACTN|nr:hypothetical protein [Streptosporangium becharense]MBB2911777.1 hypothetical protein [Streptosporangium becharense]MBB5822405.1 hypothetical protein [Streptosporangium becharense]
MKTGEGLARSGRRTRGRRRKKSRFRALDVSIGAAALVAGVLGGAMWLPGDDRPAGAPVRAAVSEAPALAAPPQPAAGDGSVVAADLDKRAGTPEAGTAAPGGAGATGSGTPSGNGSGGEEKDGEKSKKKNKKKKSKKDREAEASGRSRHTEEGAIAFFEDRKAMKRVKDIRLVGGYLRIYTDLPESADNSKQAIKLCEAGLDYLVDELGAPSPVVFVQGEFGENGNPVLANVLGPDDSDCRVTHPAPGG